MLYERLKLLLEKLGLSRRQFAMKINIDPGYFSRIMQGKQTPPDRILLLIECVYNVNKHWLETGEGEMFKNQGLSLAKKQILETIDSLDPAQVKAVSSFLKFLTNEDD